MCLKNNKCCSPHSCPQAARVSHASGAGAGARPGPGRAESRSERRGAAVPRAVGLAGGEAGQGLRAGASRARHWLPYGFRSGGWAGERPAPGLGASLSPGTRFLCVAGCAVPVGDAASFPPRAAASPSWEAVFPGAGGQQPPASPWQAPLMLGGRGGSFPSPAGIWRAKAERGQDGCLLLPVSGGSREGRVGAESPGAGSSGRIVWEGRGNATGNVRASGVRGSRRMGGNLCLWLLLSGQPQAGPARLSPKSPGLGTGGSGDENSGVQLGQASWAGSRTGKARPQRACTHAQLPTRRAWASGFPAERAEKGSCTGMEGDGTGRGWLVRVTPSRLAELGRRVWDSPAHPGAGAEKLPPAPGTGWLRSHPPSQLPRSFCRSQTNAAQAWGSHGCSRSAGPDGHRVPQGQEGLG